MRAIEVFRKNGYKQRCNTRDVMIYDLKVKDRYATLPETILFSKCGKSVKEIQFLTDNPENYTSLGTTCFYLDSEMLQAINKQIEEIEEKLRTN